MTLSPNAEKIAKQYGWQREEELWNERLVRLEKLAALKAPRVIIVHSCLIQLGHYGIFRALWMWLRCRMSFRQARLWLIWQRSILGLTEEEIDRKIMEE
jgi:hypothetical protein